MANLSADDIAAKFCRITSQAIVTVADMTEDLRVAGLTEVTPESMRLIASMVEVYDNRKLIGMFIAQSDNWQGIIDRDLRFFMRVLPALFEGLPVDTSLMTGPIKMYLQHKEGKLILPGGRAFPITDQRIEGLWKYFDQLMKGAYIFAQKTNTEGALAKYKRPLGF